MDKLINEALASKNFFCTQCARWFFVVIFLHNVSLLAFTHIFDGHTFEARVANVDEQSRKQYFVDNVALDADAYYRRLQEAHEHELDSAGVSRSAQDDQKISTQKYVHAVRHIRVELDRFVETIKQFQLENYLVFDRETVNSFDDWTHLTDALLPSLAFCEDQSAGELPANTLEKLVQVLQQILARVKKFYQISLQNALDHVDDPVYLKRLLELKT